MDILTEASVRRVAELGVDPAEIVILDETLAAMDGAYEWDDAAR